MTPEFLAIDHDSDRYRETLEIRDRILRAPLGLQFDDEEIALEAADFHLIAADPQTSEVIGCLVLSPVNTGLIHMRQVAVVENRRAEGIGSDLAKFSERFASDRGYTTMKLHAREPVVPFYERLGYEVAGPPFIEVTIPHREMRKRLS